jgi:endonuclease G
MNNLGEAEVIPAKISVANPKYAQTGYNDITVIVLKTPATTPSVLIATREELNNSDQVTLVGFGNSDPASTRGFGIKRSVRADIVGIKRSPSDDLSQLEHRYGFESDIELLAGGHGFDSCNGDSGGPGYITVSGIIKVAALTSRGFSGVPRPCGDGGIYTRIDVERDFIVQVASDYGISIPAQT